MLGLLIQNNPAETSALITGHENHTPYLVLNPVESCGELGGPWDLEAVAFILKGYVLPDKVVGKLSSHSYFFSHCCLKDPKCHWSLNLP